MALKAIIIDDDKLTRVQLTGLLKKMDGIELIEEFDSAVVALNRLENYNYDFLILDFEMPDMTGLEFINNLERVPPIILMSAHKDKGTEAFEYNVVDYIVKPLDYSRLLKAVAKVKDLIVRSNSGNVTGFFIKTDGVLKKVNYKNIIYIEALGDYVMINTKEGSYKVHVTMKKILGRLNTPQFIRVHRSYIVRKDKIEKIDVDIIEVNKKLIPVGRSYKAALYEAIDVL